MSAVTLETLSAEVHEANEVLRKLNQAPFHEPREYISATDILNLIKHKAWVEAIYIVARDHGLEAAMLFKLSDGVIDPRIGGQ